MKVSPVNFTLCWKAGEVSASRLFYYLSQNKNFSIVNGYLEITEYLTFQLKELLQ